MAADRAEDQPFDFGGGQRLCRPCRRKVGSPCHPAFRQGRPRQRRQDRRHSAEHDERVHRDPHVLVVPWTKIPSKRPRKIILPASTSSHPDPRPIRAETCATLVTAIAKGRHWLDELIARTVTNVEQIAAREKCSIRQVNRTITLAFIAPTLVQAAIDGRLPRGIGVATVRDFPAEWARQYERLGLAP